MRVCVCVCVYTVTTIIANIKEEKIENKICIVDVQASHHHHQIII